MPDAGAGPSALSPAALEALRDAARRHGAITIDMLGRMLPVDRLSPEELARTIATIEDAGIPIELDRALARPRRPADEMPRAPSGDVVPEPEPEARSVPQRPVAMSMADPGYDAPGPNAAAIHRLGLDTEARVSGFVIGALVVVCAAMIYVSGLLA